MTNIKLNRSDGDSKKPACRQLSVMHACAGTASTTGRSISCSFPRSTISRPARSNTPGSCATCRGWIARSPPGWWPASTAPSTLIASMATPTPAMSDSPMPSALPWSASSSSTRCALVASQKCLFKKFPYHKNSIIPDWFSSEFSFSKERKFSFSQKNLLSARILCCMRPELVSCAWEADHVRDIAFLKADKVAEGFSSLACKLVVSRLEVHASKEVSACCPGGRDLVWSRALILAHLPSLPAQLHGLQSGRQRQCTRPHAHRPCRHALALIIRV